MEVSNSYQEELRFIKAHLPAWKEVSDADISFTRLNSLSNIVYKVTAKTDIAPKDIILRVLGKNDAGIDREKEAKVFEVMAELGLGPKLYAKNNTYRCEEYLDANLIKNHQINEPYWRRKLAIALAKQHSVKVPGIKQMNVMLERIKETDLILVLNCKCELEGFTEEQIKKLTELKAIGTPEEQERVRDIVPKENLILSHNDVHSGNILVTKKEKRIYFIDYEFYDYNNRAYDAACLFVKSMVNFDVSKPPFFEITPSFFPKYEDVKDFATYYLYASRLTISEIDKLENDDLRLNDNKWLTEEIKSQLNEQSFAKELDVYMDEFQRCCLLCHYDAILWGVLMCEPKKAMFSFDYLSYAYERSKYYLNWRERLQKIGNIFEGF